MGTGKTSNVMEPSVISLREERVSDGQLLERFIFHRDETAFADLVHRYGTLVLGVCLVVFCTNRRQRRLAYRPVCSRMRRPEVGPFNGVSIAKRDSPASIP